MRNGHGLACKGATRDGSQFEDGVTCEQTNEFTTCIPRAMQQGNRLLFVCSRLHVHLCAELGEIGLHACDLGEATGITAIPERVGLAVVRHLCIKHRMWTVASQHA